MKSAQELEPTRYHPSYFENLRYVYPVVGRRSGGVSIGVNLSPTKRCNFRCVYCQVDRTTTDESAKNARVDFDVLTKELTETARWTLDGTLFQNERFSKATPPQRILRDFAFSGDGEPTLSPDFGGATDALLAVRQALKLNDVKLVLITNSTRLQAPEIVAALDRFVGDGGEIWAKLDAGDAERLRTIDRTAVPLETILANLDFAARRWGVVVQTAALSWNGARPTPNEVDRYCDRVRELVEKGGKVAGVQLYTVARIPSEPGAVALSDAETDAFADAIREKTRLPVDVFYSK